MHPVWSGAIVFGLVSVPVDVLTAAESHAVTFRMIHTADLGRVRVKKTCSAEATGAELAESEIGRGYETAAGVVPVSDADLDSIPRTTARAIELAGFAPTAAVDPLRIGRAYYLIPRGPTALKPYTLLRMALERSSRVAIARYAMRDRERLGLLRVVGDVIALHQLRAPDEVRDVSAVPTPAATVTDDEIQAALELADALGAGYDLAAERDRYREAVEQVVAAKVEGRRLEQPQAPTPAPVVDLMAALEESVRKAHAARGGEPANSPGRKRAAARGKTGTAAARGRRRPSVPG